MSNQTDRVTQLYSDMGTVKNGLVVAAYGTALQCQKDQRVRRLQLPPTSDRVVLYESTDGGENFEEVAELAKKSDLSAYDKNTANAPVVSDCNSPGMKISTINSDTKNSPTKEGVVVATEGLLFTVFPNRGSGWNAQMALMNSGDPQLCIRGADASAWGKWKKLTIS